jgi:hypothetical protein
MSRRFGRNQRRRMREALAASEKSADQLKALTDSLSARLIEADDFSFVVGSIVGRQAIIAGVPVTLDYRWDRQKSGDRIAAYPYQPALFDVALQQPVPVDAVRLEILDLLDVKVVQDVMRPQLHALVTLADKTVGYAISQSAIKRMTDQEITRVITPQIVRLLVQNLKPPLKDIQP